MFFKTLLQEEIGNAEEREGLYLLEPKERQRVWELFSGDKKKQGEEIWLQHNRYGPS